VTRSVTSAQKRNRIINDDDDDDAPLALPPPPPWQPRLKPEKLRKEILDLMSMKKRKVDANIDRIYALCDEHVHPEVTNPKP